MSYNSLIRIEERLIEIRNAHYKHLDTLKSENISIRDIIKELTLGFDNFAQTQEHDPNYLLVCTGYLNILKWTHEKEMEEC